MTPNHLTGLVPMSPVDPLAAMIAAELSARPEPARDLGYAVVAIGRNQQAQGPVTHRFRDGRVTIDAGGPEVTGHPVGATASKGWWAWLATRPI